MADSNFQDAVVLNQDTLSHRGEQVVIGTGAGSKSLVLQNDAGAIHIAGNPVGTVTVVVPSANGTLAFKSDAVATNAFAAGTQTATSGTIVLSNSNGISFGMSGSTQITASVSREPSIAAGTQTGSSGTVVFSNSNNVSFGMTNSSVVTASVASSLTNVNVSAGTTSNNLSALVLSNSNGVSFGLNGSTITGSVATSLTAVNISGGTTSNNLSALTFANANGVSFGLNGSTLTASVAAAAGGGIAAAAGTQTGTSGTIVFSNSNGVTFGMSNSSVVTASIASSLTNINLSAGTTSNNLSAFVLSNSNNVSFGLNGSTITASASVASSLTNINVSAGTTSNNLSALVLSNSNGLAFGLNGSTITGSYSQSTTPAMISFNGTSAATAFTSGTLIFADGGNGIWQSGGSSVAFLPLIGMGGGTDVVVKAHQIFWSNSNGVSFGTVASGAPGFLTMTASVAAAGGGLTNINVSAGTTSNNLSKFTFNDSNRVSFGLNASTFTASIDPGVVAISFPGPAANTLYSTGTMIFSDNGQVTWATAGGSVFPIPFVRFAVPGTTSSLSAITFSNSNGVSFGLNAGTMTASHAINVSAGATSNNLSAVTFSNSNSFSFGLNGSVITGSFAPVSVSSYEPYPLNLQTLSQTLAFTTATSGVMSLFPLDVNEYVLAEMANIVVSMNFSTSNVAESWSQTGALQWGLYTRLTGANSTRMSTMASSSFSYGVSFQNSTLTINQVTTTNASGVYSTGSTTSAGLNLTSQYTGLKQLGLGLGTTLIPGRYWLGLHHRGSFSSVSTRGIQMSVMGMQMTLTGLAPMGSLSSAYSTGTNIPLGIGGNWKMGHASYSVAGMTAITGDITMSQMTQNLTVMPHVLFVSRV